MTITSPTSEDVVARPKSADVAPRPRTRRPALWRRRPQLWMTPLIAVLMIGGWMATIRIFDISPIVLPEPYDVAIAFGKLVKMPVFWDNFQVTFYEFGLGFVLGAVTAIIVGAIFARLPILEKGFSAYIIAFQNFPKIAIAPLFVTWFGFGAAPKVLLAMILGFFPVFVNVIAGLKSSSREQRDLMKSLAASEWQTFWMLRFKVAMPYLFAGLRVSAVFALLGAITGEFISSQEGLGYMLQQLNAQLAVDYAFALLIVMGALGVIVSAVLGFIHRRIVFWDESVLGAKRSTEAA